MVTIIAAVARNGAIGNRNKLIYWLPADLRRFRLLTTGHTILMGRRTYESLPKGALPHRRNCVLTRSVTSLPGCECFPSWSNFIATCRPDEDIYIIGGASLYRDLIDRTDRLCLTEVDDTPAEADTFFPVIDRRQWHQLSREEHQPDERHAFPFAFVDYERIPSPSAGTI